MLFSWIAPGESLRMAGGQVAWTVAGIVVLFGLILLVWDYRRRRRRPLAGWIAFFAKTAALALLALAILEPMVTGESPRKGANDFVVLADNSRGMMLAKGTAADPQKAFATSSGELPEWMEELENTFRVQSFAFDRRLRRVSDLSSLDYAGEGSAMGSALGALSDRYQKRPLAGVLVVTDGNATDEIDWDRLLDESEKSQAPIFPVVAGGSDEPDLGFTGAVVTQTSFEDAPVSVAATVSAQGFAGKSADVVVKGEDGKELTRENHLFEDAEASHVFSLRIPLAKPGVSFLTLEVEESGKKPDQVAEATEENNRYTVAVDRGADQYRVLYVTGRPNWEYKFFNRALSGDSQIQLVSLVRIAKREPKFEWRGRVGEMSNPLFRGFQNEAVEESQRYDQPVLIRMNTRDKDELSQGFPKDRENLFGEYHAVIIDDLEAEFFTQEQMTLLENFVSLRGGSLLMLGGQESFQPGGYDKTPIGRMLPVYLDQLDRNPASEDARFDLTREGNLEPSVRLRPDEREEEIRLAMMPGFYVVNRLFAIKPGASVLATVKDDAGQTHPAIVTQRYGEGRSAAMTVGDLWRWGMMDEKAREDMEKAWRQLVRSLVVDVPDLIELETRREGTDAADRVNLSVRVRDKAYRPLGSASVKFEITEPSGEVSELYAEPSLAEAGLYEAAYYPDSPGGYRVQAVVTDEESEPLGTAETGWSLNPNADEYRNLRPNRELLEKLAQQTGGKVLSLGELGEFASSVKDLDVPVMEVWTRPLWHAPWVIAIILALLALEWGLRRWSGGI